MTQDLPPLKAIGAPRAVESQEMVVFYRSSGHYSPVGDCWHLQIRGSIFSSSKVRFRKRALLHLFQRVVKPEKQVETRQRFLDRAHLFLQDTRKGKSVPIAIANKAFVLPETLPNGYFETTITIQTAELAPSIQSDTYGRQFVQFCAHLPEDDQRIFTGEIELVSPTGVSIVSDVDDTIKVTNVANRKELLANTFTREFRSVDGMPQLYQSWAKQGGTFHYVSSSPWPLYQPLVNWLDQDGFPVGAMHLRHIRLRDLRSDKKKGTSFRTKLTSIQTLLRQYPQRTFFLCGDSGERDAEIYSEVARDFGRQISFVAIRDCSENGVGSSKSQFLELFKHLPADRWTVFRDPQELNEIQLALE
ncbi:phosphatidate phosphatase App1 family protein [Planctomicrobium sp. SH668]|uniref:phosphatidate phosphatase App1 family protein n=1 Tax=Planctomicrobium sp. SH668 TaxID=3448126 RepID=UPI003F5BAC5C